MEGCGHGGQSAVLTHWGMADESQTVMTALNKPGDGSGTDSDDWVGTGQSDTHPMVMNVHTFTYL